LKLSDAGTFGAEQDAATMAAVLARTTGAELELSDARTTGAEVDAATMAAVLTRAPRGRAGRGDDGCRPGAPHGAELELSDVGATGPSWAPRSCPNRASAPSL
jgi:hypothetical protein